ncbi:hypothetical protein EMIT0357P_10387 [Pseudomonas marginalis]
MSATILGLTRNKHLKRTLETQTHD